MHDLKKRTSRTIVSRCTCVTLRRASRIVTQVYDEALERSGLRVTQYSLLGAVLRAGIANITGLAEDLVLDRTTLTRNLKPLERRGLIKVSAGVDQRERTVSLTAKGRETLERALPLWQHAQAMMQKRLGVRGVQTLASVLSRLAG